MEDLDLQGICRGSALLLESPALRIRSAELQARNAKLQERLDNQT